MDSSIWSRLPDDLLDRILAFLPLKTLSSLRPTCKRFNSLLFSPSFLSLLNSSSSISPSSFLILSHPQFSLSFLPLYNSSTDLWRKFPLSPAASSSPPTQLLSSSSGLLLFCVNSSSFLVLNLLTNCSTHVRSPTNSISSATLISAPSSSPHGYEIFVPCSDPNWVFVYNSQNRSWVRFHGLQSLISSHQNGILFNGSLLFTTPEPFSVVGFDLGSGALDRGLCPQLPSELTFVRVVSGGDKLYLVGGVGRNGISRSVRVWELVGVGWEEVGRLPELMCRKFVSVIYHNYSHVYCLWHQGLVCVCCTTWPEVLFFKVGRGSWHWLPRCPLLQDKWSCGFRWFSYVPDLYALV